MHLRLTTTLTLMFAALACGPAPAPAAPVSAPERPWVGREAELFPDSIDPLAAGIALVATADAGLRDRTQLADHIARVKVTTTSTEVVESARPRRRLAVVPFGEALLRSKRPPPPQLELTIDDRSAAVGIAQAMEGRLVGRTFIGFFRVFTGPEGQKVHFHLAPDTPETAAAIREAAALAEVTQP